MFHNPESPYNRESFPQLWQRLEQLNRALLWARENLPTEDVAAPVHAPQYESAPVESESLRTVPYFDAKLAQMQERAQTSAALTVLADPANTPIDQDSPNALDEQERLLLEAWRYATPADEQLEWLRSVTSN